MEFVVTDFNGAEAYFATDGASEWKDISTVLEKMPIFLQSSDEASKKGTPIFDPKGSNAHLTGETAKLGWIKVAIPPELAVFGKDWDRGKGGTLAEFQFSNYPFLWNNVIRAELLAAMNVALPGLGATKALLVITKSGSFPSSNSTLYYEQALAQANLAVESKKLFTIPTRLVGLCIPKGADQIEAAWSVYSGRYGRQAEQRSMTKFGVTWGAAGMHGNLSAKFSPLPTACDSGTTSG